MKNNIPKISVVVICYNQEDVISRALDSVICQKEYVYEIIVSDDCSIDRTWDIVQEYAQKYSTKIKIYRHNQNQGIYPNIYSTFDKVNGDIIYTLSGDDEFGNELFEKSIKLVEKNKINVEEDKFCILTNYAIIKPNGDWIEKSNHLVTKYNPFSLKIKGLIISRALGVSKNVFTKNIKLDNSLVKHPLVLQESTYDDLPYSHAEKVYYLNYIGNVYYSDIGISTKLKHKEMLKSRIEYCDNVVDLSTKFSKSDKRYLKFIKIKSQFILFPNVVLFMNYSFSFIKLFIDPTVKYIITSEIKQYVRNIMNSVKKKDKL